LGVPPERRVLTPDRAQLDEAIHGPRNSGGHRVASLAPLAENASELSDLSGFLLFLESKSSPARIKPDEPNRIKIMNTPCLKLLIVLYALTLTTGAGLLAAESPAPGGLSQGAPSTRNGSSPPADPGTTAGPQVVPQAPPKTPKSSNGAAQAIPILLVVFSCPVAIVGLVAYFRARKQKQLHETLRAMIEKGVPIPPELLRAPTPALDASEAERDDPRTALRQGLFLVALGVGIGAWLLIKSSDSWGLGFIPFLVGLSFLAEWRLEKRS
jgi:hypothetical protein